MTTPAQLATLALPQVVVVTGTMTGDVRQDAATELVAAVEERGTLARLLELPEAAAGAQLAAVLDAAGACDVLVVDGGGLLAPRGPQGTTTADLARALLYKGTSVGVVVVPAPGEGAANEAALHAAVLRGLDVPLTGVVDGGIR